MAEVTMWGMIDAQPILYPIVVNDLNVAVFSFPVPTAVARSLVLANAFQVVEQAPGTAQLDICVTEYPRGPWGTHNGLNVGVLVRPLAGPDSSAGSFLLHTPVSQRFSSEAARRALGLPTSHEDIQTRRDGDDFTSTLTVEGQHVLTLGLPTPFVDGPPARLPLSAYFELDGQPQLVRIDFDMPTEPVEPSEVTVELGGGWLADTLRRLGLPRTPSLCLWGERVTAVLHRNEPVRRPEIAAPRRGRARR